MTLAHGSQDSGTSTRAFGTILIWMQEKTAPCFVIATANDIARATEGGEAERGGAVGTARTGI